MHSFTIEGGEDKWLVPVPELTNRHINNTCTSFEDIEVELCFFPLQGQVLACC